MKESFDKIFNPDFLTFNESEVIIEEADSNAEVKEIKLINANFYSFKKELIDHNCEIFKGNTQSLSLTSGCDGIVLFEKNKQWYLFLIELKSKFSTTNVKKAKNQVQLMYPKLMMYFNICKKYVDINQLIVKDIIVSNSPNSEVKSNLLKKHSAGKLNAIEKIAYKFINNKNHVIDGEDKVLTNFGLSDYCNFDTMELHYVSVESNAIDITKYI
ncbi:MAG: hypothetical protein N4A49_05145 [Marinifilaceae bacterium]|jgi:hypothetical protein|nr:hypothetical protein [Marinifilaceae bacterium]